MPNEWDGENNLTDEEIRQQAINALRSEHEINWQREHQRREVAYQDRRDSLGFFNIDEISQDDLSEEFPWHAVGRSWRRDNYTANKTHWICHNCGNLSWKNDSCSELFKCYVCYSRNVTLIKAGDISRLVRENSVGINMEDVYEHRRERFRVQRRQRSAEEFDT